MKQAIRILGSTALCTLSACSGGGSSGGSGLSNLSYPADSAVLAVGVAAPTFTPSIQGTTTSWSIAPSLPAGLDFDGASGTIQGTPTQARASTTYTVTANSSRGKLTIDLDLAVERPARLLYLPDAGDGQLSIFAVDATTGALSRVGSAPLLEGGKLLSAFVAVGEHGYALARDAAELTPVALDPRSGRASAGTPVGLALEPVDLEVADEGKLAFVLERSTATVHAFRVDATSGDLIDLGTTPAGAEPIALALSPDESLLFVASGASPKVESFALDRASGALTKKGEIALAEAPSALAVAPGGGQLALTLPGAHTVAAFSIERTQGSLAALNTRSTTVAASDLVYHPSGRALFVVEPDRDGYQLVPVESGGNLGVPQELVQTADLPSTIQLDAAGLLAFVASPLEKSLEVFAIDPLDLASLRLLSVPTRGEPLRPVTVQGDTPVVRESTLLYALASGSDAVASFGIEPSTGELTSLSGDILAGDAPSALALDPFGRFLFVASRASHELHAFPIDPNTGVLGNPHSLVLPNGLEEPSALAVDGAGRFLYVAADSLACCPNLNFLVSYKIDQETGELSGQTADTTWSSRSLGTSDPKALRIDPSGRFLYLSTDADFQIYAPAEGDVGLPSLSSDADAPIGAHAIAFTALGKRAWVTIPEAGLVRCYDVDLANGGFSHASDTTLGDKPWSLVALPGTSYLYASLLEDGGPGSLRAYAADPGDGALTEVDALIPAADTRALALDAGGARFYGVEDDGTQVRWFSIDRASGAFEPLAAALVGLEPVDLVVNTVLR